MVLLAWKVMRLAEERLQKRMAYRASLVQRRPAPEAIVSRMFDHVLNAHDVPQIHGVTPRVHAAIVAAMTVRLCGDAAVSQRARDGMLQMFAHGQYSMQVHGGGGGADGTLTFCLAKENTNDVGPCDGAECTAADGSGRAAADALFAVVRLAAYRNVLYLTISNHLIILGTK